jgi:hypothetical protein
MNIFILIFFPKLKYHRIIRLNFYQMKDFNSILQDLDHSNSKVFKDVYSRIIIKVNILFHQLFDMYYLLFELYCH